MADLTRAVFISYASQDAEAAQRLKAGLETAGVEVWLDQSELRGGDSWDQMIRRQIKSCAVFIPLISANTRARQEGYFRLEWKLAIDRSHLMAAEKTFLLPVAIDGSSSADATIPERFREVQWTTLAGGEPSQAFIEHVSRLLVDDGRPKGAPAKAANLVDPVHEVPKSRRSGNSKALAALALVLVAGGAWVAYQHAAKTTRIIAYSTNDRRMTFAFLPLQAGGDEAKSQQMFKVTNDIIFRSLDENHEWVQLVPKASVAQASAQYSSAHDLAKALNVHFLIRGDVSRLSSSYRMTLLVVDGETEHVLGSKEMPIPVDLLSPAFQDEIDGATGLLVFYALETEVERARHKPDDALDVRDLTYRAFVNWGHLRMADDGKRAYSDATGLLNRALRLSPDDPLALRLLAKVNLCDCVEAWSSNIAEQQAIGEAAVNRYLSKHPDDEGMLHEKATLDQLRGRYQESLLILDSILNRHPENFGAMYDKAFVLMKLGRLKEAAPVAEALYAAQNRPRRAALVADIHYALGDFVSAEHMAQKAIAELSKSELSNANSGTIRLTLIAAAANLKHEVIEKTALADLAKDLPELSSLGSIRKWMDPQSDLYNFEPLFAGLKLAGLQD